MVCALVIDITSGLPRVEELFEARVPKGEAILSEIDGVVEVRTATRTRIIKVVSRETYRDEHDLRAGYEPVVKTGDWVEVDQTVGRRPRASRRWSPPERARSSQVRRPRS